MGGASGLQAILRGVALRVVPLLLCGGAAAGEPTREPAGDAAAAFSASASIPAEILVVGESAEVMLIVEQPGEIMLEFWWERLREAGEIRRPILLIEHNEKVELAGAVPADLVTPDDFQVSYLRMPYGRRVMTKETSIAFTLLAEPEPDDVLALNVITYLEDELDPQGARFVRRRIELPLRGGAQAQGVSSEVSRWGQGETLAIGDTAPDFELPDLTNRKRKLSDRLGDQRVLILAYRRAT